MARELLKGESGGPQPPPWLKTSLAGPFGADTDSPTHSTLTGARRSTHTGLYNSPLSFSSRKFDDEKAKSV